MTSATEIENIGFMFCGWSVAVLNISRNVGRKTHIPAVYQLGVRSSGQSEVGGLNVLEIAVGADFQLLAGSIIGYDDGFGMELEC